MKKKRLVCRAAGFTALAYVLYVLLACTLPFISPPAVSGEAAHTLQSMAYTAEGEGPDRALLVESTTDAMNLRLALLQSATASLDVAYHAIHAGDSAEAFLGELLHAADRGVQVRLLVDGTTDLTSSGMRKPLRAAATHENLELRFYNPPNALAPSRWNALLHDKFILADGTYLLLGGRNIGDAYFAPAGYTEKVTQDRDVLVWRADTGASGSVMDEAAAYMDLLWNAPETKPYSTHGAGEKATGGLRQAAVEYSAVNPAFCEKTLAGYLAQTLPTSRVTLVYNPVHTGSKEPWVGHALRGLMQSAAQEVVLQTPYATGNGDFLAALADTAAVVPVTMLTNSLASSPNFPAYSNYNANRGAFAATGARIFELQSVHSIHGKSLVVDGRLSAVGSFNMDDRSLHLDTESMLVIDSEPFAQSLLGAMDEYIRDSLEVDPDGDGYIPGGDAVALAPSTPKRVGMWLASLFSRPLQFLV